MRPDTAAEDHTRTHNVLWTQDCDCIISLYYCIQSTLHATYHDHKTDSQRRRRRVDVSDSAINKPHVGGSFRN